MIGATLDEVRAAAARLQAMSPDDFSRRRSAEAGDALVAMFIVAVQKLFAASEPEAMNARRVELMLTAFFLKGELSVTKARAAPVPVDEARAREVVGGVTAMSGAAFDARVTADVGDSVLAFFSAYSNKVMPDASLDRRAKNVQVMVWAFLVRAALEARP